MLIQRRKDSSCLCAFAVPMIDSTVNELPACVTLPKVLLLTLIFSPDGVSTAVILTELARRLKLLGHDVIVVTTTPHYNKDVEALAAQPLKRKWGPFLYESDCQGIPVYHARVQAKGRRIVTRLFDYLQFHAISTLAGLRLGGDYQVVLAPSPPLTIGLSAALLAALRRVPFVYNVQEIYPDIAVRLGVLKRRSLIRALEWLERFIYSRAEVIVVISERFRQRLLGKGVPSSKLRVIPNFVDVHFIQPAERRNSFSQEHNLDQRFVVLYSGNIGLTQDFETILETTQILTDLPDICFLIVGDGARRDWLAERISQVGLSNVRLLPYQPRGVVPQLYASSDVCLVPLRRGTAHDTFPSKIYTIMAAARPAIASADPDSELAWVVQQAQCGLNVAPSDPWALAEAVRTTYFGRDRLSEMGRRGRDYVVRNHSPEMIARQYHELLLAVASGKRAAA